MKRGELWWAQLDDPIGSGPGFRRPVVIVQSDSFNRSAIRTVIAAMVTSNIALAMAPGNVRMSKSESGLGKVSVVNVTQLATLDREQLLSKIKALPASAMGQIELGIREVLSLS
jgi:mRNA interferase MazF